MFSIRFACTVQLPIEHLNTDDKNPTDLDVIETVCYTNALDTSLKSAFNGIGSTSEVDRVHTYFGSWTGVMRIFPGASYDKVCGDYDPRIRPWYVTASSGPKDVVILLDISSSMRNNNFLDVAKDAVKSVLETMNEYTFVNVVKFNTDVRSISPLAVVVCTRTPRLRIRQRNDLTKLKFHREQMWSDQNVGLGPQNCFMLAS